MRTRLTRLWPRWTLKATGWEMTWPSPGRLTSASGGAVIALLEEGEKRREVDPQRLGLAHLQLEWREDAFPLGMNGQEDVLHAFTPDQKAEPGLALVVVELEVGVADVHDGHEQVDALVKEEVGAQRHLRGDLHLRVKKASQSAK